MKKPSFSGWLILGVIFWNTVFSGHAAVVEPPYRANQILIQPKPGVAANVLADFHAAHQCRVLRTFAQMKGLQIVRVPPGETVKSLIAEYQRSGLVEFAEPDYFGHVFNTTPNDPQFLDGTLWGLNQIDAPSAWDVRTSASNIVVAVLDTGVRYTHEDLVSNMWSNPDDGGHGWNALTQTDDPSDDSGHGTLVAGVLGATGNNGKGVTGVAWRVQIMACKCFNSLGIGSISDVVTCLDYARTNGARVINASWGFTNSLALSNAIADLRDAGIIVVAACGNSATDIDVAPTYPASYDFDNIVSVADSTPSDTLAGESNYGAHDVDLAAPGENIYSTFGATDNFYYSESGTSFSAPYVSGACALLLAQYPADSAPQIINRLLGSVDPIPALAGKCRTGGRLNLRKALRTIQASALPQSSGEPFRLLVDGGLNRACVVEVSTNLLNWMPVSTNSSTANGTFIYTNAFSPNSPVAFFRATGDE